MNIADWLPLAVAVTLLLSVLLWTRRQYRTIRPWTCPRWLGQPTRGYYKLLHGYDPAMPHDWTPHHSLREKKRYG